MNIYRTRFKKDIVAEFVEPVKSSNKVMIFCGGMPSYPNREKYKKIYEYFSKRGYWCITPRYRGSWESDGLMFKKSPHLDILDVIDEIERGFVELWEGKKFKIKNPEVYLLGSSFGGPATLLCSSDKRVKKVICFSPVIDWREMKETIEPIPKMEVFVKEAFGMGYRIVKGGWNKIEKGLIYNPTTKLSKIDGKKCLIIHAKDDTVVTLKPLKLFIEKTNSKLILVPKGGHLGIAMLERRFKSMCIKFLD